MSGRSTRRGVGPGLRPAGHGARRSLAAVTLLLALAASRPAPGQEPDAPPPPSDVTHGDAGYSINTQSGDLMRILNDIGGQAGFTVVDAAVDRTQSRPPVAVAINNVPLDRALQRLLRSENYVIVYRGGGRRTEISADGIEQIILLSPAASAGGSGTSSPLAGPQVATRNGQPPPGDAAPPPAPGGLRGRRLPPPGGIPPGGIPPGEVGNPAAGGHPELAGQGDPTVHSPDGDGAVALHPGMGPGGRHIPEAGGPESTFGQALPDEAGDDEDEGEGGDNP